MRHTDFFGQVLGIDKPWEVVDVFLDRERRRINITVGLQPERSGWFARFKAPPPAAPGKPMHCWRHGNLGPWRCYVLVSKGTGQPLSGLPWAGDEEVPLSRITARQAAMMLAEGVKLHTICQLLDVDPVELWKLKFALDHGKAGLALADSAGQVPPSAADAGAGGVPDPTDPVWERLLTGTQQIEITLLSLRLMLAKLRTQMLVIEDPDVRMLKVQELHRYFQRNERLLARELAQLRGV